MALSQKDKQDIYVSYRIGINDDESVEYTPPIKVKAQITDTTKGTLYTDFGKTINYDKIAYFDMNSKTQYIDEYSRIWIGIIPVDNDSPNYEITRYTPISKGMFMLYLNGIPTSHNSIYYLYNNKIYETSIKLDIKSLKGSIPLNMFLPIDNDTKIWTRKPESKLDTNNMIRLIDKSKKDSYYLLVFEEVKNG